MPETIRLKTQVGIDREINIQLDQDFEQLEILSLKVRSEDVYTRMCADYGVVVGRVVANGGYGVPNVKVSVFVPLTEEDSNNEIISTLYPYTSLSDVNEDGYRYNLLPYESQHTGHVPTGTFPTRNDVLTNPAVIEVYDKYYKFTVKTNGSGDYMIMGVPVGAHTLVMDCDLSDIGPFSQSPQDLIRMGRASADQLDGVNFKSSTNLYSLPQIVTINQSVNVNPFWGQPEVCQINIARNDFDLRSVGINIQPSAIFMGSLVTGINDEAVEKNCKPPRDMGNLCNLSVGPGEIISVRQTIYQDTQGRPILEQGTLPQGGKVIDGDGTWVLDVPMNLNYVTTNEFGEQVFSQDPTVGIPTKGKYRFKVKYTQPTNFESQEIRRGYFLVPNIKEYGWVDSDNDPAYITNTGDTNYQKFIGSYYFGTDWSGYTNQADAIACKDTFYEMDYNKVYTVAQHYDEYKKGFNRSKFIGIKEITDSSCASENNKFPATDGVQSFDFLVFLLNILLPINYYVLLALLPIVHVLAFIWPILQALITFVYEVIAWIVFGICKAINLLPGINLDCKQPASFGDVFDSIRNPFIKISLPNISYPDCQLCDCGAAETPPTDNAEAKKIIDASTQSAVSPNADFFNTSNWNSTDTNIQSAFAGIGYSDQTKKLPIYKINNSGYNFVNNLPIWETINKFNLKSKYFDSDVYAGSNRIKVVVEPKLNGTNPNLFHYDNVMALIVDPGVQETFKSGQLLSFQQALLSKDPNPKAPTTGTTTGVTGTTIQGKTITVNYADPSSQTNKSVTYSLSGATTASTVSYKFATDIEYFQVITGTTYDEFITNNSNTLSSSLKNQIDQQIKLFKNQGVDGAEPYFDYLKQWLGGSLGIIFLVRGVDPHSGRKRIKYDLSRIFGHNTWGNVTIENDFFLNIPVQVGLTNVRHNQFNNNTENHSGYLYYDSYTFTAGTQYSSYTSNLQSYYSSLDVTQINVFQPTTTGSTTLISSMVQVGTSGELLAKQVTPSGVGYYGNEYIEGGSYIWYGNYATVNTVDGDNNNGVLPQFYYAPAYPLHDMTMYSQRMVMRSDRLPTGTQPEITGNNHYAGQASVSLTYSLITDNGNAATVSSASGAGGVNPTNNPDITTGGTVNKVIESFSCAGMVDLNCYINQNGEFIVLPNTNDCNTNVGGQVLVNGCYRLVNKPILSLLPLDSNHGNSDYVLLSQWLERFRMNFAICRGVLSHTFVNSWLNGSLFAFPFESSVFFDKNNKPYNRKVSTNIITGQPQVNYLYCGDLLVFEPKSSNFYYRSSPYDGTKFVGSRASTVFSQPVNTKDLLFPTTILDMGPKYIWQSEVNKTPNYFGYQMNKFNSTTWSDDSGLLQLFIVSRLVNQNFLQRIISGIFGIGGVGALFSRDEDRVDGDFAQMLQINSQYGVTPFTAENYPDDPNVTGDNPIYVSQDSLGDPVFGVFFSGFTADRDLISPRRIDRTLTGTTLIADYLGTKSQEVPFFKWTNNAWISGEPSIFGNQNNSWYTYGGNPTVESKKYQEFDRRLKPFFQGNNNLLQNAYGYIYQRNPDGTYNIKASTPTNDRTLTSAPWYFYFGLKKGKSAMDKYVQQYLGTETNV